MKKILIAAMSMVMAAACGKANLPLENTSWRLVELNGKQNEAFAANEDSFWFSLDGKQIVGTGACNRFFGSYELSDNNGIEIGPMGMTKMFCPNIDLEDAFARALDEADGYSIAGDRLTLTKDGEKIAVFKGTALQPEHNGMSADKIDAAVESGAAGQTPAEDKEVEAAEAAEMSVDVAE